jgi:hypothetical protein
VPAKKTTPSTSKGKPLAKKGTAKKGTAKKGAAKKGAAKATARKATVTKRAPRASSARATSARRGDLLVIDSVHVGSPAREGEILKVIAGALSVSYQVRWGDGHESFITPVAGTAHIVRT